MKNSPKNYLYTTKRISGKTMYVISIQLRYNKSNGRSTFHIGSDRYDVSKTVNLTNANHEGGGANGNELAKLFPEFKRFNLLDDADFDGVKHIENLWHLFDNKEYILQNYMITEKQYNTLDVAYLENDKKYFKYLIGNVLYLTNIWKMEAEAAINWLEENAQTKTPIETFGVSRWTPLTEYEIAQYAGLNKTTYYNIENVLIRKAERDDTHLQELLQKAEEQYEKEKTDFLDKLELSKIVNTALIVFFKKPKTDINAIYYHSQNKLKFNWLGYNNIPQGEIDAFIATNPTLPKGCEIVF